MNLPDGSELCQWKGVYTRKHTEEAILEEKELLDEYEQAPRYSEIIIKETPSSIKAEIVYEVSTRFPTLRSKLKDVGPKGSPARIALAQRVGTDAIELLKEVKEGSPCFCADCVILTEPVSFLCWSRNESSLASLLAEILTGDPENPRLAKTFKSIDEGDYEKALRKLQKLKMSEYD